VLSSISGQNERWAQLAALQPPPATQSSQDGGQDFSNSGTVASGTSTLGPIASNTASPLSNDMNFMLMMFGGGTSSTSSSGSTTQTTGPDDTSGTSITQGGTSFASLLTDLQSLLSTLGGGTSSTTDATTTSASIGNASTIDNTGSVSSTLRQDLDSIASDLGTIAASFGGIQPPPPPPDVTSSGQSANGISDISNTATASVESAWSTGWGSTSGAADSWRQQFGFAAYAAAADQSGLNTATTSAQQSINV
jgi:hypothetical protein